MLLAIDIGNSNITIGAYEDKRIKFIARLATDSRRTADQYAIEIRDILHINNVEKIDITDSIISSVVPTVGRSVEIAVEKLYGHKPLTLGPGVKTGLNIKIDNPGQLGADLAAGAVGAVATYSMPCIVIDLGTASTISVMGKNGEFLGGAIAAGIKLTLEALTSGTAQLPLVNLDPPKNIIGTNTVDCMKSGLIYGAAAMLDGMITRIEKELGEKATIVATGGLAAEVTKHCEKEIILDENLLLDGLRLIYNKNKK